MPRISTLTLAQLERAVAIKNQIEALEKELQCLDGNGAPALPAKRGRRKGWSKLKAAAEAKVATPLESLAPEPWKRKRRRMSAAGRARVAAAQKARWEKVRAQKAAA